MEVINLGRYLVLNGESDTWPCPDWYPLIVAARYLGVAPWELLEQGVWWKEKALKAMKAEYQARKINSPT